MRKSGIFILVTLACLSPCYAGLDTISAEDAAVNGASVIVARVEDVKKEAPRDPEATHTLTINPIATIAGVFDPSTHAKLKVALSVHTNSSVSAPPEVNSLILAVILPYEALGVRKMGILSSICTFMPKQSACITLTGLDDKRILVTLARIREERARAAEEVANDAREPK